jgi:hypothetical protein
MLGPTVIGSCDIQALDHILFVHAIDVCPTARKLLNAIHEATTAPVVVAISPAPANTALAMPRWLKVSHRVGHTFMYTRLGTRH